MKKIILSVFFLSVILFSCSEEKEQPINEKSVDRLGWATLKFDNIYSKKQNEATAYLFNVSEIATIMNDPAYNHARFVLGYSNNAIEIEAVGVTNKGEELTKTVAVPFKGAVLRDDISKLENKFANIAKKDPIINNHQLIGSTAFSYIDRWKKAQNETENLESITSYNGERIRHFVMDNEVLQEMLRTKKIASIGVIFGVNPEGKMTTVFIGFDSSNKMILPSKETTNKDTTTIEGAIFDFTKPCPTTCDPTQI